MQTLTVALTANIRDVIAAHPAVGTALAEFNISCVTCSVGTCQLRDVVSLHNLSEEDERALFARIAGILYPGRAVELPKVARKASPSAGTARGFSPPLLELVNEHRLILRVITLIPRVVAELDDGLDAPRKQTVREMADFVRNYADRFHHAKEEEVLFKFFDSDSSILRAMHQEHELGRGHIRATLEAVERGDAAVVRDRLRAYGMLLTEHIRKEDEILYPWMDRELTDTQVGHMYAAFREVDKQFGPQPAQYRAWVERMEAERGGTTSPA